MVTCGQGTAINVEPTWSLLNLRIRGTHINQKKCDISADSMRWEYRGVDDKDPSVFLRISVFPVFCTIKGDRNRTI